MQGPIQLGMIANFLLLLLIIMSITLFTVTDQSGLTVRQAVAKYAPKFHSALKQLAPHLDTWLQEPDAPFTLLAPVDSGCEIVEYSGKMKADQVDQMLRYHIAVGRHSFTRLPALLSTGLEGEGLSEDTPVDEITDSLCFLPMGVRQKIKVYEGLQEESKNQKIMVFDGELPPATLMNVISCKDGVLALIDRTLFPPTVIPGSIRDLPIEAVLQSLLKQDLADFRRHPLTLFLPQNDEQSPDVDDNMESFSANHAVHGLVYSSLLVGGSNLKAISGMALTVTTSMDGEFLINNRPVIVYDIPTSFGVVHIVDGPLFPSPPVAVVKAGQEARKEFSIFGKSEAVKPSGSTIMPSTPMVFMLAGAMALCIAVFYAAYRRRT